MNKLASIILLIGLMFLIATPNVMADLPPVSWNVPAIPPGGGWNDVDADITITVKSGSVEFKVEINSVNVPHGVYGMGIAISTSISTIDFQVFYQEWTTPNQWYYQAYPWVGPTIPLPHLGITATGAGAPSPGGKVFAVEIPNDLLGGCGAMYYYAIQFRTNLIGTWPSGLNLWVQTDATGFASGSTHPCPVGGVWTPIDMFELLAPWIGLASLIATAVSVVYVKNRRKYY